MVLETIILALSISSVVSTETTGKGLADHTISTVKGQDCKIVRGVKGNDMCRPVGTVAVEPAPDMTTDNRKPKLDIPPVTPQPKKTVLVKNSVDQMEDVFAQRRAAK